MPQELTTLDDLTATVFAVTEAWDQATPWDAGGLISRPMPPGCFVRLDPPVAPLGSDHDLVRLGATVCGPDGAVLPLRFTTMTVDDGDGRLVLFFEATRRAAFPAGCTVRFADEAGERSRSRCMTSSLRHVIEFALSRATLGKIADCVRELSGPDAWMCASRILDWIREWTKPPERRRKTWHAEIPVNGSVAVFVRLSGLHEALVVVDRVLKFHPGLSQAERDELVAIVGSNYAPKITIN